MCQVVTLLTGSMTVTQVADWRTHGQLLVDDHLADGGVDDAAVKVVHGGQLVEADAVVDAAVAEEVGAQTLHLDLLRQLLLHARRVLEQVPHLTTPTASTQASLVFSFTRHVHRNYTAYNGVILHTIMSS